MLLTITNGEKAGDKMLDRIFKIMGKQCLAAALQSILIILL